jgi:hypothetical protein
LFRWATTASQPGFFSLTTEGAMEDADVWLGLIWDAGLEAGTALSQSPYWEMAW